MRATRTAYLLRAPSLIGPRTFVGLDNVAAAASDGRFARSLLVTIVFVIIVIPAQTLLGLRTALVPGVAWCCDHRRPHVAATMVAFPPLPVIFLLFRKHVIRSMTITGFR